MAKKWKMNLSEVRLASSIISLIYFGYMVIRGFNLRPQGDFAIYYWCIGCFAGTALIYSVFYYWIFDADEVRRQEKETMIMAMVKKQLSTKDYKEVIFLYENSGISGDIMNMIVQIIQKEECRFYAKLAGNGNIKLIAKDKHDEEVYNVEIENARYFDANFKFKE